MGSLNHVMWSVHFLSFEAPANVYLSFKAHCKTIASKNPFVIMSAARVIRTALRARPAFVRPAIQRRGYADVASDKIQLSLTLPHQSIYKSTDV